jgi:hypothetical protein
MAIATGDDGVIESGSSDPPMHPEDRHAFRWSRARLVAAALLVTAAAALSGVAGAADAEVLIRSGLELRKASRDQEALSLFQQAVEAKRTPRGLAQLGLCEQALGLWPAAERHLDEALKGEGDDAWRKKNAITLRESLAFVKGKVGAIEVWGTPEGATVILDDDVAGTLPLRAALRVAEGRRTFRVEAPGYVAETRTIEVRGGTTIREHVALARSFREAAPVAAAPRAEDPSGGRAIPIGSVVDAPPPSRSSVGGAPEPAPPYYARWWFWTAIAAGVVGAGVATYLAVRNDRAGGCVPQPGAPCW